jgi:MFS family permease
VYAESEDPVLLGIVGAARILPYVVLSVPAGIIIDRFDRRMVLLVTDVARGLIMVAMTLVVATDGPVLAVVALAILATCFSCFFRPAIGAYLPSLVRDERELGPANSLFATLGELSFIVGPAVAGLIIAASDLTLAFAINAVTFGVIAIVLFTLPPGLPGKPAGGVDPGAELGAELEAAATGQPAATGKGAATEAGVRARLMLIRRPLIGILTLDTVAGFMFGGLSVITVLIAVDQLNVGEAGTGYLNAAVGVGGVLGAIGAGAILARRDLAPAMLVGALGLAIGFIVLGFSTAMAPALIAMAIIAAGSLVADIVSTTVFQRIVEDDLRGRVLGGMQTLQTGTYAAGAFLLPVLFSVLGPQVVLPIGGLVILVAGVVALAVLRPYLLREPDAAADVLTRVSRLPLFAGVPGPALEAAAGRLEPVAVRKGDVIVRQGDPADRFYVIESGSFVVDQQEAATGAVHRLRTMGRDEVFGELGLMHGTPRTATVTAETDGTLLALPGPAFLELVGSASSLSGRLNDRYRGVTTSVA